MRAWRRRLRAGAWGAAAALIGASGLALGGLGAGAAAAEEAPPAKPQGQTPYRAVYSGESLIAGALEVSLVLDFSLRDVCEAWVVSNDLAMRVRGGEGEGGIFAFEQSREAKDGSLLTFKTGGEITIPGMAAPPQRREGEARPGELLTFGDRRVRLPKDVVFSGRASADLAEALARGEKRLRRKLFTPPAPQLGDVDPVEDLVVEIGPEQAPPEDLAAFAPQIEGRRLWRVVSQAWDYSSADGPPTYKAEDLVAEGGILLASELSAERGLNMVFRLRALEILEPEPCGEAAP